MLLALGLGAPSEAREVALELFPETKIELTDDALFLQLREQALAWERALSQEGLDVEFRLSSGELRRLILGQAILGPGDFEFFVLIKNENTSFPGLDSALELLMQNGLDLRRELRGLVGQSKELDIFYKDKRGIERGKSWTGNKSTFNEMGETSLNRVAYSFRVDRLYGSPEDQSALRDGVIYYLEEHKSRTLDHYEGVTNVQQKTVKKKPSYPTAYPRTILRQALRCIRLDIDLAISPNPNNLKLDEATFNKALEGFVRYFQFVDADADLSEFKFDSVYLGLFLKIFKNRSPEDRKKISKILNERYSATLALWRRMGLNPDLLLSDHPNTAAAIIGHASMWPARLLWDSETQRIQNPFDTQEGISSLIAAAKPGNPPEAVPAQFLRIYSPRLIAQMRFFDSLEPIEQNDTIKGFLAAVDAFNKPAAKITEETTFRDEKAMRLLGTNFDSRPIRSGYTLLQLLTSRRPIVHRARTLPYTDAIEASIQKAKAEGKTPTITIDLDDVVFPTRERMERILHEYDRLFGTAYFQDVEESKLLGAKSSEIIAEILLDKVKSYDEFVNHLEAASHYVASKLNASDAIQADLAHPKVAAQIRNWHRMGAKIIYITARPYYLRDVSLERLRANRLFFRDSELFIQDRKTDLNAADFKIDALGKLMARDELSVVLFADNTRLTVEKVMAAYDGIPHVLQLQIPSSKLSPFVNAVEPFQTPNKREKNLVRVPKCASLFVPEVFSK